MTFDAAMAALEAAGTEQTRKTYRRHGASDPLFGDPFGPQLPGFAEGHCTLCGPQAYQN